MSNTITLYPFKLTKSDVERSSTLEHSDIGKWAVIVWGAIQIVSGPMPVSFPKP